MDRQQIDAYAEGLIRKIARQLARRPEFRQEDPADIRQALWADLLKRRPRYRPERGRLTTFVRRVVEHQAATLIQARRAAKRGNGLRHLSFSHEMDDGEGGLTELGETISQDHYLRWTRGTVLSEADRLELAFDLERAAFRLPAADRVVCLLLVELNISDVARVLGVPRSTLYGTVYRLRRVFRELGLHKYFE